MAELKTKATKQNPKDFLNTIESEEKRKDSLVLLAMYQKITGQKPVMWGTAIVGFDKYHYKSERSAQQGDWPLVGFSPRKQNLTFYFMSGFADLQPLLKKLGKHTTSVGCLYIKRLSDVDITVLAKLIETTYKYAKKKYNKNI